MAGVFKGLLLSCCWAIAVAGAAPVQPEYPAMGQDIFDAKAPAESLITAAVQLAQHENKKVVLFFGANWCPWCRRLHAAFDRNPAVRARLAKNFVLVYVDANTRNDKHRNAATLEKYGQPVEQFGLPVLVLLNRDGGMVATRETASLAADTDHEVADRVRVLLDAWAK